MNPLQTLALFNNAFLVVHLMVHSGMLTYLYSFWVSDSDYLLIIIILVETFFLPCVCFLVSSLTSHFSENYYWHVLEKKHKILEKVHWFLRNKASTSSWRIRQHYEKKWPWIGSSLSHSKILIFYLAEKFTLKWNREKTHMTERGRRQTNICVSIIYIDLLTDWQRGREGERKRKKKREKDFKRQMPFWKI